MLMYTYLETMREMQAGEDIQTWRGRKILRLRHYRRAPNAGHIKVIIWMVHVNGNFTGSLSGRK